MAREGMRFTQFYAGCTTCAPSRSVLLTGHTWAARWCEQFHAADCYSPGQPTLASMLKGTGYRTACIGKWGVGTPDNFTNPNDVGFDHFYGYVNMWRAQFYPEFLIRNSKVKLRNEMAPRWKAFQDPKQPRAGRGVAVKRVDYCPICLPPMR